MAKQANKVDWSKAAVPAPTPIRALAGAGLDPASLPPIPLPPAPPAWTQQSALAPLAAPPAPEAMAPAPAPAAPAVVPFAAPPPVATPVPVPLPTLLAAPPMAGLSVPPGAAFPAPSVAPESAGGDRFGEVLRRMEGLEALLKALMQQVVESKATRTPARFGR